MGDELDNAVAKQCSGCPDAESVIRLRVADAGIKSVRLDLPNLLFLDLTKCPLTALDINTPVLHDLVLRGCGLHAPPSLKGLPQLRTLDMRGNSIPLSALDSSESLRSLYVDGQLLEPADAVDGLLAKFPSLCLLNGQRVRSLSGALLYDAGLQDGQDPEWEKMATQAKEAVSPFLPDDKVDALAQKIEALDTISIAGIDQLQQRLADATNEIKKFLN